LNKKLPALHSIFLKKFSLLFISMFLILGIVVYFWIKDIYIEQIKSNLLHNIEIISLELNHTNNLNKLAKDIKKRTYLRVTIINQDGKVIAESDKDYKYMENHYNRKEIVQARLNNIGSIIRYSHTVKKELLYVAKKFKTKNNTYYIRVAKDINSINKQFLSLSLQIIFILLLFIGFAFYISLKISEDVQYETTKIFNFLKKLTNTKKAITIESNYSKEFSKITKLLTSVSSSLAKKQKQKSKYTAKLKLANRQKDDIISAISHEFKNPITVINGYIQTLLENKNINKDLLEKFLLKIDTNSKKLATMIDRLRLSIKLDENKQAINLQKIELKPFVLNIIDDIKQIYPNRNIELNIIENPTINIDKTLFEIALLNIIENGLKYSQDDIKIEIANDYIEIEDYGIGIEEKELEKIKNKFYRVSNNSWDNSLGLGLFLVQTIIKLHNFSLEIKSIKNQGTIIKIIF